MSSQQETGNRSHQNKKNYPFDMAFTLKDIEKLQKLGKIRGFQHQEKKKQKPEVGGRKVAKHFKQKSKEKDWLYSNVLYWANSRGVVVNEEYVFHPDRKWRFDLFLRFSADHKGIGIEYEGIGSEKSRHTTIKGYSGDTDKYREAAKMGITVLRYTVINYQKAIEDLNQLYDKVDRIDRD